MKAVQLCSVRSGRESPDDGFAREHCGGPGGGCSGRPAGATRALAARFYDNDTAKAETRLREDQLATVCVARFLLDLSDRQAAEAGANLKG